MDVLSLDNSWPLVCENAGLFISRGVGSHPRRIIESHELIVVRSGTLYIREEATAFTVRAGEALILFPGRLHVGTQNYDPSLSFYWLHFRQREGELSQRNEGAEAPRGPMAIPQYSRLRRPESAYELFQRFLNDQETGELTPDSAALLTLLMLLELTLVGYYRARSAAADALVGRAETVIRKRFAHAVSTQQIAAEVGCNPDYLGRIYRAVCGQTLVDALNETRVREAARLLRESAQDMNHIAHACGFSSHNYFCRVFRLRRGMSPLAYRRLHSRSHVNTS